MSGTKTTRNKKTAARTDGLGMPLVSNALYYVQDCRTLCGNCIMWWAKERAGYVCNLDDAGLYTGDDVASMRGTDVPWPRAHVEQYIVKHVRGDNKEFRRDRYEPGPR